MKTRTISTVVALAAAAMFALSGCAGTTTTGSETTPVATTEGASLSLQDGWVKAADKGMSAAFGTLKNNGTEPVTVVSAESDAAPTVQLHETVKNEAGAMVMREKEGGFTIPAGASLELAPGGNHLMMMGLQAPIKAGDVVGFALTLEDGSTYDFTVPAKDYTGANETYEDDGMGTAK